ncbi:MAG TPA: DUF2298 domain-containing protein, partial [Anaerolineae bacterium]
MLETLTWWVLVELIGLAVWPFAFRFFRNLPDRGYAFLKPLGLLLVAYPFWLLTTFGFLNNTQGAIALVAILVAAVSWGVFGRGTVDEERQGASAREEQNAASSGAKSAVVQPVPVLADGQSVTGQAIPNGHTSPESLETDARPATFHEQALSSVSPLDWLREHLTLVLAMELVFTLAFFAWVVVRAYMPEIQSTEKPMEFAFLNGILRSEHFP